MGMLLALLDLDCSGDETLHRALLPSLSHEVRLQARRDAQARGGYEALFELEREENDGDRDGEPLEIPNVHR